jgi:hypothetical protein
VEGQCLEAVVLTKPGRDLFGAGEHDRDPREAGLVDPSHRGLASAMQSGIGGEPRFEVEIAEVVVRPMVVKEEGHMTGVARRERSGLGADHNVERAEIERRTPLDHLHVAEIGRRARPGFIGDVLATHPMVARTAIDGDELDPMAAGPQAVHDVVDDAFVAADGSVVGFDDRDLHQGRRPTTA